MIVRAAVTLLKRYVSPMLDATGLFDRRLARRFDPPGRLLVLMYHRVIDDASRDPFGLGMCVQRSRFVAQLDYLQACMRPMPLREVMQLQRAGRSLPPRAVALTFDDGYLDNLQVAAPLLAARGIPATFFVATGGLRDGRALWWDRVIAALAATRLSSLELPALRLERPVAFDGAHRHAGARHVLQALWRLPVAELPQAIDELVAQLVPDVQGDCAFASGAPRMTFEQVASLHAQGFEIGAHTVTHVDMRDLCDTQIRTELHESQRELSAVCGEPIAGFAYPSGFHSRSLQNIVRSAGFDYAVSTDRGINVEPLRRFAICRVGMPDSSVADFKRALSTVPVVTGDAAGAVGV